jgi:hypothetical protein
MAVGAIPLHRRAGLRRIEADLWDHYVYAGLGTVLDLSKKDMMMAIRSDAATLAGDELSVYQQFADASEELQEIRLAQAEQR